VWTAPDPAKQGAHGAVPQYVHVVDAVGAGGHPGDQARCLQVRVYPGWGGDREVLADQGGQAVVLGKLIAAARVSTSVSV
jgi:hypothetical protein